MENKNLPELHNPMINMLDGNMPGLPQIIQNSMPVEMPRASYNQSSIGLFFGNVKRKQLVKAMKTEAEMAEYAKQSVHSKLEMITDLVTCSARLTDTMGMYEHNKTMRNLEVQEKQADIYIKHAQAQQMGFEAKLSELDYNIRLKQHNEMMEGK